MQKHWSDGMDITEVCELQSSAIETIISFLKEGLKKKEIKKIIKEEIMEKKYKSALLWALKEISVTKALK